jgi:hypothetical protein
MTITPDSLTPAVHHVPRELEEEIVAKYLLLVLKGVSIPIKEKLFHVTDYHEYILSFLSIPLSFTLQNIFREHLQTCI